ncbi:MAG: type 1 glutamine amidotransferase [Promethearchaeota archaeon]
MHILFLQNWPSEGPGRLGAILTVSGVDLTIVETYKSTDPANFAHSTFSRKSQYSTNSNYSTNSIYSAKYPNLAKVDAIIIGGMPISVNLVNDALLKEKQYLIQAISHHRPILGICAGSQLLAKLLGAEIYQNPVREIGISKITITPDGKQHPLFAGFPSEFHAFQWHEETFTLPPEATQLAFTSICKQQAFARSVWFGLQFHLELRPEEIIQFTREFLTTSLDDQLLLQHLIDQSQELEDEFKQLAYILMKNFLAIITADKQNNEY